MSRVVEMASSSLTSARRSVSGAGVEREERRRRLRVLAAVTCSGLRRRRRRVAVRRSVDTGRNGDCGAFFDEVEVVVCARRIPRANG